MFFESQAIYFHLQKGKTIKSRNIAFETSINNGSHKSKQGVYRANEKYKITICK